MSSKRTLILGINLLWTIIIFVLCVMPSDDLPNPRFDIPHIDKVVHFGMYFVSSLLMMYPLERYRHPITRYYQDNFRFVTEEH